MKNGIKYPILLLAAALLLQGCLSIKTIKRTRFPREYPVKVESAFIDKKGDVTINFTAKHESAGETSKLHVTFDPAAILSREKIDGGTIYMDESFQKKYSVTRIHLHSMRGERSGLSAEFTRDIYGSGHAPMPAGAQRAAGAVIDEVTYRLQYDLPAPRIIGGTKIEYILLDLPQRKNAYASRYFILPFAVLGDIVTSPVQLVIAIFFSNPYMFD